MSVKFFDMTIASSDKFLDGMVIKLNKGIVSFKINRAKALKIGLKADDRIIIGVDQSDGYVVVKKNDHGFKVDSNKRFDYLETSPRKAPIELKEQLQTGDKCRQNYVYIGCEDDMLYFERAQ
jgi:bifunctional DNA-binding transcriptional regulator/antitoxin component of YhaV-PrlF toxin-antitoxin module